MAFNKKRAISRTKKSFKQLPKKVVKQLPNAALLATGGVGGAAVKGARVAAKTKAAKKAAKKVGSSFKLAGQKRRVRVKRRDR